MKEQKITATDERKDQQLDVQLQPLTIVEETKTLEADDLNPNLISAGGTVNPSKLQNMDDRDTQLDNLGVDLDKQDTFEMFQGYAKKQEVTSFGQYEMASE